MYWSYVSILGFTKELVTTDEIRVGVENFNSNGFDRLRAKRAFKLWLSLITTGEGSALVIVQSTNSPSAAWRELLQRYLVCGLKEEGRLMQEFNSLKMELGEDPKNITMRVDRVARGLRRVAKAVNGDDNNLATQNGLTQEYAVE